MAGWTLSLMVFYSIAISALLWSVVFSFTLSGFLSSQDRRTPLNHHPKKSDGWLWCILWNLSLLFLNVAQHSGMASEWWKGKLHQWGLSVVQRALYVMATVLCLQILLRNWSPIPGTPLWYIDTTDDRPLTWLFFWLLHLVAWFLVFGATLVMDFPEMIGLKQVYYLHMDREPSDPMLHKSRGAQFFYGHMRHAGATCFLLILWLHPMMTVSRLLVASFWSTYLMCGFHVRDDDYAFVQRRVQHRRQVAVTYTQHWEIVS